MKLIKFIMVTALIFSLGDVFAQQNTLNTEQQDHISAHNHGTQVFSRCAKDDETSCSFNLLYLTCRSATESDHPSGVTVECFCSANLEIASFTANSVEYLEYSSIDAIRSVSIDLCLTSLHNLIEQANMTDNSCVGSASDCLRDMDSAYTYSCSELSYCFIWDDKNGNGVYDPGE